MKVLYTSDLHGEKHFYRQIPDLVRDASAGILALGGDLLPTLRQAEKYEELISVQKLFIGQFLVPFLTGLLETTGLKQILLIPGNWDAAYPHLFAEILPGVSDLSQRKVQLANGYEWIGYPFVPPTPFRPKDYEKIDVPESPWPPQKNPAYVRSPDGEQLIPIDAHIFLRQRGTIAADLEELPQPGSYGHAIYLMHSPPYGTRLDMIQGGRSAGSRSIRAFIERHQPLLTLHGHIHESPEISGAYSDQIGKTLSVNPGQSFNLDRSFPKVQVVIFEMENPKGTLIHTGFR